MQSGLERETAKQLGSVSNGYIARLPYFRAVRSIWCCLLRSKRPPTESIRPVARPSVAPPSGDAGVLDTYSSDCRRNPQVLRGRARSVPSRVQRHPPSVRTDDAQCQHHARPRTAVHTRSLIDQNPRRANQHTPSHDRAASGQCKSRLLQLPKLVLVAVVVDASATVPLFGV